MPIKVREDKSVTEAAAALRKVWDKGGVVCDTATLKWLARENRRANRALDIHWLNANADPDGLHIVNRLLLHNDVDWRCRVLVKRKGDDVPVEAWQDVTMKQWDTMRSGFEASIAKLEAAATTA
jgi:hypothetical protein